MNPTSLLITPEEVWLRLLQDKVHLIDVRAPVEFSAGRIPSSVNHPILNDEERTLVGTTYKQQGSAEAVALGHRLIQGEVKESRVQAWVQEFKKDPEHTFVTCFRGGMRSQITQTWLAEKGIYIPRIAGGYKKMRQLFLDQLDSFSRTEKMLVLTGKTGSGKTQLLQDIQGHPILNLEFLAQHRGSTFGAYKNRQPSQIDFENNLTLEWGRQKQLFATKPILVEDESRLIGRCVQPDSFFELLRQSPVLFLDEPIEKRIENILQEYVIIRSEEVNLFTDLSYSLGKIRNKLGGLRYAEISEDLEAARKAFADHRVHSLSRVWIEKLILWYYDPLYQSSLDKRNPEILARGDRNHILSVIG